MRVGTPRLGGFVCSVHVLVLFLDSDSGCYG
jgi:hypothetical protein